MDEINPYQAPSSDMGGGKLSTGSYEFSDIENSVIQKTATRTKIWGVISMLTGALAAAGLGVLLLAWNTLEGFIQQSGEQMMSMSVLYGAFAVLVPLSLVHIIIGVFYIGSSSSLALVAQTEGNDVELLMTALDRLANAFRVEVIVTVISAVIGLVVTIANTTMLSEL